MSSDELRQAAELMTYEKDIETRIATLTINRPDKLNAPTSAMRMRYAELLHRANVDDDVKVLVIRGVGDHFGSGADLVEQQVKLFGDKNGEGVDPLFEFGLGEDHGVKPPAPDSYRYFYNIQSHYASARGGCRSLQEFKKISIVETKGYCYGWHFYQAGDADFVIASDDTLFGHAAFRYYGFAPRMWTWIETMGLRAFQEMLFTGRPFTAEEMKAASFVNSVVPRDKLEDEVRKYALGCAANGPVDRIVMQKSFLEMYKQHKGEYFGSLLSGLMESLGGFAKADRNELALGEEMLEKGLANAVKEADAAWPPEWRLTLKGRKQP